MDGIYLLYYSNRHSIFKYEFSDEDDKFIEACVYEFKSFVIEPNIEKSTTDEFRDLHIISEFKPPAEFKPPVSIVGKHGNAGKIGTIKKFSGEASKKNGHYLNDLIYRNDTIDLNDDIKNGLMIRIIN